MVRAKDYDNITYLHNMATVSERYSSEEEDCKEMVPVDIKSTVSIRAKYAYTIPAIGITISRILDLLGKVLLLMGRIINLFAISFLM